MKTIILNFKFFIFVIIVTLFSTSVFSQCAITTTTNASALTCGSGALTACNGVLNIGNGSTSMSLVMNTALNLSCLGPMQLVVKNGASLDFSSGNDYLTLAAGSSIVFEGTGTLIGGSCNASERIYIGTDLIATCNGGGPGADFTFAQLVANGGFNFVKTATSIVCGSGSGLIGVSVVPTPVAPTSYNLYSTPNSLTPIATTNSLTSPFTGSLSTPSISTTTTYYVSATSGSNTTPRKAVTITVNGSPNNISNGFSATTICSGGSPQLTYDAEDATFTLPYTIVYKNNATGLQYSASISTASPFSFTPGDNPTSNAGYDLVSISNASCTNTSVLGFGDSGANLIVRALPTSSIGGTTTVCQGGASPSIAFTNPQTAAIIVTYNVNGGTSTSIDIVAGSASVPAIATVAVPTTTAGGYTYNLIKVEYKTLSACFSTITGVSAVVTVNTTTTPIIGIISQPDCLTAAGTFKILNYNSSLLYSFTPSTGISRSGDTVTASPGSYTVTASNGSCFSGSSSSIVINPIVTNKWTGSWSTGANPVSTEKIEFAGNYTAIVDLVGCSCEVLSGSVTFLSGTKLTLTNDLKVTGGSLTFEDSASLVQINNVSNSGNIRYMRATQGAISNFDYTYWSSPVSPQTLFNVSPLTLGDKFYSFNGPTDSWVQEPSSTVMGKGMGYIIRGPQTFMAPSPPSFYQATFIGVPNNGNVNIPIGTSGEASYLLGNPYPSALDGETFIKNNAILDGTLYFWTHGTKIGTGTANLGSGSLAYTSDDYASYNLTGGAAASSGGAIPIGKIGSGQGFFVTTIGSGAVNFTNSMRVGVGGITGDNSQFFKTQMNTKSAVIEKNRLWLDFFNKEGAFKQALIGYVSGATNSLDKQYDGESFDANEYVDFYSILNNKNLVIQGRAVPFDKDDKVLLGYKTTIEGEFTIKIKQFDGLFDTQDVFIEDKLLKIKHDLKKEGYTFTTAKGAFDDRFVLFYTHAKGITATTDLDVVAKSVLVSTTDKDIKIASSTANIEAVKIFDLSGKEVFYKQKINSTDLSIRTLRQGNTVYVVKIKLDNGQTLTQKVIY